VACIELNLFKHEKGRVRVMKPHMLAFLETREQSQIVKLNPLL